MRASVKDFFASKKQIQKEMVHFILLDIFITKTTVAFCSHEGNQPGNKADTLTMPEWRSVNDLGPFWFN